MKAPSRKIGWKKRETVAIGTTSPCSLQARWKLADDRVALGGRGVDGNEIVVVQIHAVGADLAEHGRNVVGRNCRADEIAEGIAAAIADGPQAEGEFVLGLGLRTRRCSWSCVLSDVGLTDSFKRICRLMR